MHSIKQILQLKGSAAWSISPRATAYQALQLMSDKDVGALLVMDADKLVGIFSERDYTRKGILMGRASKDTLVSELMSHDVLHLAPSDTVNDGMALMTAHRIRHIPILEDGRVLGVVSIGDLVKQVITDQEEIIQQMEQYIRGESYA